MSATYSRTPASWSALVGGVLGLATCAALLAEIVWQGGEPLRSYGPVLVILMCALYLSALLVSFDDRSGRRIAVLAFASLSSLVISSFAAILLIAWSPLLLIATILLIASTLATTWSLKNRPWQLTLGLTGGLFAAVSLIAMVVAIIALVR